MLDNYVIDKFGIIHQIDFKNKKYDEKYFQYYEGLKERTIRLGFLRMGYLVGTLRDIPNSILEIGYGPGSFVDAAKRYGVNICNGTDVEEFPLPKGVDFLNFDKAIETQHDVVAMFDVLEHIPDLSFMQKLNTQYVLLSVPICMWNKIKYRTRCEKTADEWLENWRMFLPDEHLHHFDGGSLMRFMIDCGYERIHDIVLEDGLRLRKDETGPNILTAIFKKVKNN